MTEQERLKQIPNIHNSKYRRQYKKAMTGKSLRSAVNSFCLECVAYERVEVAKCTDTGCPLFQYRPYKNTDRLSVGSEEILSENN